MLKKSTFGQGYGKGGGWIGVVHNFVSLPLALPSVFCVPPHRTHLAVLDRKIEGLHYKRMSDVSVAMLEDGGW